MSPKTGSTDTASALTANGSSPHHQVVARSAFSLPHRVEFDQTYRYVSALTTPGIDAYHTMDARISWQTAARLELSLVGQNLLQPHHAEFTGDPGTVEGIARSLFVRATWR